MGRTTSNDVVKPLTASPAPRFTLRRTLYLVQSRHSPTHPGPGWIVRNLTKSRLPIYAICPKERPDDERISSLLAHPSPCLAASAKPSTHVLHRRVIVSHLVLSLTKISTILDSAPGCVFQYPLGPHFAPSFICEPW